MRLVCEQALKFILYFVLCFEVKKEKKNNRCGFGKENESFDENRNTFVNKNPQNLKMYIQK